MKLMAAMLSVAAMGCFYLVALQNSTFGGPAKFTAPDWMYARL